ncbi:hypothetical protein CVT24_008092 [Panaeolus cyanescens]|uniref:Uncharacterized protein n=1 Tax=Panaeolus cyanescens TaxID=181874 RepID=A0A409YLJ0_9AGAR|nr:hypothetical protein CVT24_008092 [Panaeolus cyanescens]
MPTATATVVKPSYSAQLPLKATISSNTPSPSSQPDIVESSTALTTLRTLYNRATRAFVLKDIALTHTLLQSGFALLKPPTSLPDAFGEHRRKWDILRITFESTVYTSPPASTESLPESLRDTLTEPSHALANAIYSRSLALFTPCEGNPHKAVLNAAYLPLQVLTTLVYCCLKLDAADVGRVIVEDWLARREPKYSLDSTQEPEGLGYDKVLELYTLHILPRLEQWDYAKEFLDYENELPAHRREALKSSLNTLYTQTMASRRPKTIPAASLTPSPASPRPYSPAPSSSSSSSSLSTTSTHTVVPSTPRGAAGRSGLSALSSLSKTSSPPTSSSSSETTTPRIAQATLAPNGNGTHHTAANGRDIRPHSKSRTASSASSGYSNLPRASLAHQATSRADITSRSGPLSSYALIKASLAPYLSRPRLITFLVLFVLVPLVSFVLKVRRRRAMALGSAGMAGAGAGVAAVATSSNAEIVRRRLQSANTAVEVGLLSRAWSEIVRAITDTVKMAGSGLV